jgi:hypothetical protein
LVSEVAGEVHGLRALVLLVELPEHVSSGVATPVVYEDDLEIGALSLEHPDKPPV